MRPPIETRGSEMGVGVFCVCAEEGGVWVWCGCVQVGCGWGAVCVSALCV